MFCFKWLCLTTCFLCLKYCYCDFRIPSVILEAYEPAGFRASIPAESNIELFAFHGKLNREISSIEPGEFSADVKNASEGFFTYYNPNLKLSIGDTVHYWIFVQHNQLGYRKDGQKWSVKELKKTPGTSGCQLGVSEVSDRTTVCFNTTVFLDNFDGNALDETKWLLEQYVPTAPDYEFVIYKKDSEVIFLKDTKLIIKPKFIENESELKSDIDLTEECTKPDKTKKECYHKLYLIQNPVVSGRLVSKISFLYGEYEVKAKLPEGDWIFPEIYLEDEVTNERMLIGYTRGNSKLVGQDGKDIGSSLLYGGPLYYGAQKKRSFSSIRNNEEPFNKNFHVYKLLWAPDKIELFVDDQRYDLIEKESPEKQTSFLTKKQSKVRIVLGVGVGGISDFPDDFKSGTNTKPWKNKNSQQVKKFFKAQDEWYPSWTPTGRQLQIEYVKVTAI